MLEFRAKQKRFNLVQIIDFVINGENGVSCNMDFSVAIKFRKYNYSQLLELSATT